MIDQVVDKKRCFGCFACYNICPVDAIEMKISDEGFYIPSVKDNCIECMLCTKVCPAINSPKRKNPLLKVFAAWSLNENTRLQSSSGGAFQEIARAVLEDDGIVYGVAWGKNLNPEHVRIVSVKDLPKTAGSKYVPSYVGFSYRKLLDDILEGKTVLFSGLPCQIAGCMNFLHLKKVNLSHVYFVDLICYGVPSLRFYNLWLSHIVKDGIVTNINFRDKSQGWSKPILKVEFLRDGNIKQYKRRSGMDFFIQGFNLNYFLNNSCYECPFAGLPRLGDLTIGDFWGLPDDLKDEKGISVLLVNSTKGERLLKLAKNKLGLKEVNTQMAIKGNLRLRVSHLEKPKHRDKMLNYVLENRYNIIKTILLLRTFVKKVREFTFKCIKI